jgi:hypothetical protein
MTTNEIRKGVYSMSEVSTFRLYLLRAMYLFMAVGLAIFELPALLHPENLSRLDSVVLSVLAAFALLAVLGIRYPLKMLPLCCHCFSSSYCGSPSGSWLSGCPYCFLAGWDQRRQKR